MKKLLIIIFMSLCVSCAKPSLLLGQEYQLINAPENAEITLVFSDTDNRYYGKAVNNYFGTYHLSHQNLILSEPASTMMMGPQHLMQAEHQYFQQLGQVSSVSYSFNTLILHLKNGQQLIFQKKS